MLSLLYLWGVLSVVVVVYAVVVVATDVVATVVVVVVVEHAKHTICLRPSSKSV